MSIVIKNLVINNMIKPLIFYQRQKDYMGSSYAITEMYKKGEKCTNSEQNVQKLSKLRKKWAS